jgi:hypothetical protein
MLQVVRVLSIVAVGGEDIVEACQSGGSAFLDMLAWLPTDARAQIYLSLGGFAADDLETTLQAALSPLVMLERGGPVEITHLLGLDVRQGSLDLRFVWNRQLARLREVLWCVRYADKLQRLIGTSMMDAVLLRHQIGRCGRRHRLLLDELRVRRFGEGGIERRRLMSLRGGVVVVAS